MDLCTCGKPADCPLVPNRCQDCWERECAQAWWQEFRALEGETPAPAKEPAQP